MATLIDAPEFTSNEVYQIQATDPVEGAASGASFSGTGISNQPHQQLANRTAFLKQRQDVNISNIGVLQTFQALFTGLMAQNGYLKIGVHDINKGLIQYIVQWGFSNQQAHGDETLTITWPLVFPNACLWAMADIAYYAGSTPDVGIGVQTDLNGNPLINTTYGNFFSNTFNQNGNVPGFTWIAIGF